MLVVDIGVESKATWPSAISLDYRQGKSDNMEHEPQSKKRALREESTRMLQEEGLTMSMLSDRVLEALKLYKPVLVEGMDPTLHWLPPHIPRNMWHTLGTLVVNREKGAAGSVDGSRWISLRLDGSGFSRTVHAMRKSGLLETKRGFSQRFAVCMQSCLKCLMEKFSAKIGYTQSDEMVIFIPPTNVIRGEQQPHFRSGRVTKLTTLASGFISACFVSKLAQICLESEGGNEGTALDYGRLSNLLEKLAQLSPHFDCRLGSYESWDDARALLLWRAYDCSVNGVSDAVYQIQGSGKQVQSLGKREKVEWLWRQGVLPLPAHQAYGRYYVRVKRVHEGYNPIQCVRSKLSAVSSKRLRAPSWS